MDERRAAGLQKVGDNAWTTLQRHFQTPSFGEFLAGKVPFGLGQAFTDKDYQTMMRAGRDFGRSYIYMVSGANAPAEEINGWAFDNLPQFGDDPATIQDKLQALAVKGEAIEQWVGRAARRPGGDSALGPDGLPSGYPPGYKP